MLEHGSNPQAEGSSPCTSCTTEKVQKHGYTKITKLILIWQNFYKNHHISWSIFFPSPALTRLKYCWYGVNISMLSLIALKSSRMQYSYMSCITKGRLCSTVYITLGRQTINYKYMTCACLESPHYLAWFAVCLPYYMQWQEAHGPHCSPETPIQINKQIWLYHNTD